MRKAGTLLLIAVLAGLCSKQSYAQGGDKKNVIKLNVFGAILQSYTLAYERVISEKSSVQLSVGYRQYDITASYGSGGEDVWTYSGLTFVPEYRYYLTTGSKDIPRGFYVAPFFRYANYKVEFVDGTSMPPGWYNYTNTITSVGGGVMLGYQWLIGDVVSVDLFPGLQYKTRSTSGIKYSNPAVTSGAPEETDKNSKDGIGLRFGLNVGFAF